MLPVFVLVALLPVADAREEAMGRRMIEDYRQRAVPSPALPQCEAYVRKVAALLSVGVPYQLEVLSIGAEHDDPFTLPGGYVVVPVKTLLQVKDTAALAEVLAHTFGHLILNHGVIRNPEGVTIRMWTAPHASALVPLPLQARQKQWEVEADEYAAKLLQQAGPLTSIQDAELAQLQDQLKPKRQAPTLRKPK